MTFLVCISILRSYRTLWDTCRDAASTLDLILELPGGQTWAVDVKRSSTPSLSRNVHTAIEDVGPDRTFILYNGTERYRKSDGIEAVPLRDLMLELSGLS
jgi:uncharacterized protein